MCLEGKLFLNNLLSVLVDCLGLSVVFSTVLNVNKKQKGGRKEKKKILIMIIIINSYLYSFLDTNSILKHGKNYVATANPVNMMRFH